MSAGEQEAQAQGEPGTEAQAESLLDRVVTATPQTPESRAKELISELVSEAVAGEVTYDKTVTRTIRARVAAIEEVVSKQLAAILHHPQFQKLEGSWRGLNYLVMNSETSEFLKIRLLNCSKDDLKKDLESAVEFDQSEIFKKIYRDQFSMPGGTPYGAWIGDYEFTKSNDDVALVSNISQVAAAAFCPFLSAASSELFGFESWTELQKPRDLAKIFDSKPYIKWKSFRESDDSRFVTLSLPRVLARLPYGASTKPIEEFGFEEVELGPEGEPIAVDHDDYCWMNAAFVLGAKLTDAYAKTSWCTAIRGKEGGGLVEDLPAHVFKSADGDLDLKCPTEIPIDDRREYEISKLGFLSLGHYIDTDYAVFFGAQTCRKPQKYDNKNATANEQICARLPYILATSRFSHYLKILGRDKIGQFMERSDCEKWLTRWISNYICKDESPTPETKARLPLAEAQVQVTEDPENPGAYHAVIHMRPWLQMEELTASMRMVARIPKQG